MKYNVITVHKLNGRHAIRFVPVLTSRRRCRICGQDADHTWALVPVCAKHRDALMAEAEIYYRNSGQTRRTLYERIRHLRVWR